METQANTVVVDNDFHRKDTIFKLFEGLETRGMDEPFISGEALKQVEGLVEGVEKVVLEQQQSPVEAVKLNGVVKEVNGVPN